MRACPFSETGTLSRVIGEEWERGNARLGRVTTSSLAPFDALVLMSFGGPESEEEVLPFLQNVTRGRGIPDERLVEVGEHYYGFGGKSPINDQNRALLLSLIHISEPTRPY